MKGYVKKNGFKIPPFLVRIFQSEKKSILIATNTTTSEEIIETNEIKDGGSANKTGEIDIPSFREWTKKALGKVSKEISIVTIFSHM